MIAMEIADALYVGDDNIPALLHHWKRVLQFFQQNESSPLPDKDCMVSAQ